MTLQSSVSPLQWLAFKLSLHPGQLTWLMLDDNNFDGFPVQQQWEIDGCEKVSCYMYDAIVFVVHCLKLRRLACWIRGQCLGTMSDCTQGADSAPWCTSRNPCYNVWHTCCFGLPLQLWASSQVLDQLSIFIYCGDDVVYEDDDYEADDVIETCGISSGRERQQVKNYLL